MNTNISPPGEACPALAGEEYPKNEGEVVDYQHDNYFFYNWQAVFALKNKTTPSPPASGPPLLPRQAGLRGVFVAGCLN
jgi:hypothetical protein